MSAAIEEIAKAICNVIEAPNCHPPDALQALGKRMRTALAKIEAAHPPHRADRGSTTAGPYETAEGTPVSNPGGRTYAHEKLRDAERYRWLVQNCHLHEAPENFGRHTYSKEWLDGRIDECMARHARGEVGRSADADRAAQRERLSFRTSVGGQACDLCGLWNTHAAGCPRGVSSPQVFRSNGVDAITAERARQVSAEGWTPEHDDEHGEGQLAYAAACYAFVAADEARGETRPANCAPLIYWPWHSSWWKPKDARRNLVRAGALIAAEIDRIDRTAGLQAWHCERGHTWRTAKDAESGDCPECHAICRDKA